MSERHRHILRAWTERRSDFPPGVDRILIPLRPRQEARSIDRLLELPNPDVAFFFNRQRVILDGRPAERILCEGKFVEIRFTDDDDERAQKPTSASTLERK